MARSSEAHLAHNTGLIAALNDLPRPTVVTCRTGGRPSASIYLHEGLHSGEPAEQLSEDSNRGSATVA